LKCGSLPAKADTAKQRDFFTGVLYPLMEKAKTGKTALLFVDASHFVMGYVYSKTRRFIRTCSGRKRYNVLGALNFMTKKLTTITNDTYITASQICSLLLKVADEYVGMPIYLILDNARYQKCKVVTELALQLGITLVYIPPYSPNLNLIERLWKFVKGTLRTQSYDDFANFQAKIDSITDGVDKEHKKAVDKLISEKVQLFDDVAPRSAHIRDICTSKTPLNLAA
jgi:transposase